MAVGSSIVSLDGRVGIGHDAIRIYLLKLIARRIERVKPFALAYTFLRA
jgi:hypothetical protein